MTERAHARLTDPQTSHQAADAITPDLPALQARVADYARRAGPGGFTDAQMEDDLDDQGSTYRTRRRELAARNIVIDSGQTRRYGESTRQRIVWLHRDFVPHAPPVCDAPAVVTDVDREAGRAWAKRLEAMADSLRREGRSMLADELVAAAGSLKRLSA